MFISAVGQSEGLDSHAVIQSAIEQCKAQLRNIVPGGGILFSSVRKDYFDIYNYGVLKFHFSPII